MSIFREKAPNAMQYRLKNPIQEFSLAYNQLVHLEFAETKCAKFGTVAKLRLRLESVVNIIKPRSKFARKVKNRKTATLWFISDTS